MRNINRNTGAVPARASRHNDAARKGTRLICLLLATLGLASQAQAAELPGLVAKWPAQGNANDVVGDNDGKLVGGTAFARGKIGKAFKFDGQGDSVRINDARELTPRVITVECWFSATATSASFPIIGLVNKFNHNTGTAEEDSYALALTPDGGVRWQVETVRDYGIDDNILELHPSDVPGLNTVDGKFHHIAGTYDGSKMVVYLDGAPLGSLEATGRVNDGPLRLLLGAAQELGAVVWFQKGRLDEVKIYNRALSAAEIARIAGKRPS